MAASGRRYGVNSALVLCAFVLAASADTSDYDIIMTSWAGTLTIKLTFSFCSAIAFISLVLLAHA